MLKTGQKEVFRTIGIVFISICMNFIGRQIAARCTLPLWMDSFGTVLSAYVLGPWCGAIVGATGNIIFSFWDETALFYGIVSIFIGASIGYVARKHFNSFFGAMSVAGVITIGSVILSTILNFIFYQGSIGNEWGDGVSDYLMSKGVGKVLAVFIGEIYIEFLDKLVTVLSIYYLIRIIHIIAEKRREHKKSPGEVHGAAILILLIASLAFSNEVQASDAIDENSYIRKFYNADNDLPCGHANDIVQTNDGVLWVGSYAGLYRYNGSDFEFMSEFEDVKNVNCMFVDEEGRLWIGTNDSGVVLAINGEPVNTFGSEEGMTSDSIRCIIQGPDGDYYVGTSGSMAILKLKNGITFSKEISELNYTNSITTDGVKNIACVTAEGRLYILREGEIAYEIPGIDSNCSYSACSFDQDGILQVGTTDGRIISFQVNEKTANREKVSPCVGATKINRLYPEERMLWVLSDNGIGKYTDGTYRRVETGDFNYSIVNMTVDYQGNYWFASGRLGLLELSETGFLNLFDEFNIEPSVVNSTLVHGGFLYIGTDDGLILFKMDSGSTKTSDLTNLVRGSRVRSIQEDSEGNVWLCTFGKGLIELKTTGDIVSYNELYGTGDRVRVCTELSDGTILAGGDAGLITIPKNKKPTIMPYGDELGASQILCIMELHDGKVLLGTDGNGILVMQNGKIIKHLEKSAGLTSGVILRMVPDGESSNAFIVTSNGIGYYENGKLRNLPKFPYSNNYDIALDPDGEMFVMGSAGVYVLRKEQLLAGERPDYVVLNSKLGLIGSLTANAWIAQQENKDLFLATDRGVVKMNMDTWQPEGRSYRLMVSEIKLDGVSARMEKGFDFTVGMDVKSVEFIPEIVNYSLEDPKISYYLEGVDDEYKTVLQSELSGVIYTNLSAGDYIFHLAIIDEDTGEIQEERTYGFTKERKIYDNPWFIFYIIIVGGLFVGWLTWFLTRVFMQRTIQLQQEKLSLALKQVQMGNETILAIAKTVDAKDERTSKHSQRVSEYSVMIAREYGFSEEEQENIRKAALLHDIGKIGIPDAILNKPAKLSDEEYAIMKTHVTRGAEILKDFTLVEHADLGARYHHERYDGKGYPDGLKGEDIPLYGRIIAVADAFDAMTANRVYRRKLPFSKVLEELKNGRGTQFDPKLLDLFIKVIESGEINVDALYGNQVSVEGQADEKK